MADNKLITKISFVNGVVLESMNTSKEEDIIKNFVKAAVFMLKADYGFSFFKKEYSEKFQLIYLDKKTPYIPKPPRKNGITALAFKTKKPQYVSMTSNTKIVRQDAKQHMKGVTVIPISYKNSNYGTLDICFREEHNFTEEEKSLGAALGMGAAQAITINRLYTGMESLVSRRTRQLKLSNLKLKRDKVSDEAVLSSIGEGLIGTDKQGRVVFVNPEAEKLLGRKKKDMLGKSLYEYQDLVDAQNQALPLDKRPTYLSLSQGRRVITNAYCYIKKGGQLVPCAITATPIILNGETIGSIEVFRDISQEKEVDRVKTELISLASHQLRTPLSAINWYTEALVKQEIGKLNPAQKKYLGQIRDANHKMIRMVYDFLNVSRIELGTMSIKLSALNAVNLAKETLQEVRPLLQEKRLSLKEHYGPGLDHLEADQKILRVILQNLLTNAVKYTPAGGKIEISLDMQKRGLLRLVVGDNGHGIPARQQPKIFSKLFRADNAARLDAEGSGLGLYLVKSFVDLCQGKISFTSKENKGTTFTVTLPVKHSV